MQIGRGEQYYDFSESGIASAPGTASAGVFVLFKGTIGLYVRASDHMQNLLLNLLTAGWPQHLRPNRFQYQACLRSQMETQEVAWKAHYRPLMSGDI